jgi:hypothetical protein
MSKRHCIASPGQPLGIEGYVTNRLNAIYPDHYHYCLIGQSSIYPSMKKDEVVLWTSIEPTVNTNRPYSVIDIVGSLVSTVTIIQFSCVSSTVVKNDLSAADSHPDRPCVDAQSLANDLSVCHDQIAGLKQNLDDMQERFSNITTEHEHLKQRMVPRSILPSIIRCSLSSLTLVLSHFIDDNDYDLAVTLDCQRPCDLLIALDHADDPISITEAWNNANFQTHTNFQSLLRMPVHVIKVNEFYKASVSPLTGSASHTVRDLISPNRSWFSSIFI